ncbi:hypothetical protein [Changpingibacter yushuensis]|uniref:hypothetical protein n=1 Tax=Changpingibacter yushuensis TaxID=2758440 RepID=UPI0015F54B17|nr:hypothetical protein [Changpingibacter yushuensis]
MSAVSSSAVRSAAPRPVIQGLPELSVVPTPAKRSGFIGTVLACAALFVGAFGLVFFLNTQMVASAFEIQQINKELNVVTAHQQTLEDQVVGVSTPLGLEQKAKDLGMEQATTILHLDVDTGAIVNPDQTQAASGK